jgi:hypothetical protein
MAINRDFADIFGEFNAVGARYLLVGGYAVGIHGVPRFTKDLEDRESNRKAERREAHPPLLPAEEVAAPESLQYQ